MTLSQSALEIMHNWYSAYPSVWLGAIHKWHHHFREGGGGSNISMRNWWLRRKWWHWGGRGQNITKNDDIIYGWPVSPYIANDGLLPDLVVHTSSEKKGQPAWANVHKYVLGYSRPFERWLVPVKEIEIIHRLFLVIAMYCQASLSQFNESLNLPCC